MNSKSLAILASMNFPLCRTLKYAEKKTKREEEKMFLQIVLFVDGMSSHNHQSTPLKKNIYFQLAWIRLRNVTLSLLGASVICAQTLAMDVERGGGQRQNDVQNGDNDNTQDRVASSRRLLEDLMKQFGEALEEAKQAHATPVQVSRRDILIGPY